jgi:phosphate acyltransferase
MRIAIDAMGGDHAPASVVAGAVQAARELGVSMLLVGDRRRVEPELARHKTSGLDIELRHASEVVAMEDSPTAALHRLDSSMHVGFSAARDGEAAGFVFAGNTGAGMVLGAHLLGRSPGVDRPAIAVLLPNPNGHTILLDAGANVDCRPLHLTQFAVMGNAYARAMRQIAAPRVGLLSNGVEDGKGNALLRAAAPLIRQLPINFIGYVEGRDVNSGAVDVVVCDGFVGNVVLKGLEGFGRLIGDKLRSMFQTSLRTKLAYLLLRRDVDRLRNDLDASETGGALLLGLNGVAVKAHGSSDARAIRNAIAVAMSLAQSDIAVQVADGMASTVSLEAGIEPRRARRLWESIRERLRRDAKTAEARGAAAGPAADAAAAHSPATRNGSASGRHADDGKPAAATADRVEPAGGAAEPSTAAAPPPGDRGRPGPGGGAA